MNKSAIQRFATWARTELIAQVSQRAYLYGITKDGYGEANAVTVGGRALSTDEQRQRKELVQQIQQKNYTQVMEEVAYTWFNRFIALRFMEVNNYLPSHIRVFSDSTGAFKPEILNDVLHLELPGLNTDKVAEYIENNQTDDLYRYLLLTQCNALNEALPRMFERMGGYTELLLPNNILKQDGILGRMVTDIPEEDWTDQVQIIGWLYQYYNSELKDDTFALLKKNVKITRERIPSATQLFTPDWIVRYMVENSLGRLWIEHNIANTRGDDDEVPGDLNEILLFKWKYYLPEAEQEPEVKAQLAEIRKTYKDITPESIKVIDPCMGSGHILVYAFDVLMDIYTQSGWNERDAAQSILKNNLYGLDIDDRAAQLAYFAVMMKARQYDRRIFSRGIQPHVYAIVESNGLDSSTVDYFTNNDPKLKKDFDTLREELRDAKEYGSILNISQVDFTALYDRVEEVRNDISLFREMVLSSILPLFRVAEVMAQKYDIVITNPPYMGINNASGKLNQYSKEHYPISKYDLSTICMEKTLSMCTPTGMMAMINIPVWMSKSSFEDLRYSLLTKHTFINMLHCGRGIFGSDFGTTAFVIRKKHTNEYAAVFHQLFDEMGAVDSVDQKETWFFERKGCYIAKQKRFLSIASYPIAYSTSQRLLEVLDLEKPLSEFAYPRKGLTTGDNEKFVRLWFEVDVEKFSMLKGGKKWFPMTKGGDFRRWYGNNDYIVNWENDGFEIKNFKYQDLQGIGMTNKLALPTLIALCSIALGKPTISSLAVLGEISIGGTMIKVDELANALQVCLDSGAKKILLPITSAADLGTVPSELIGCFNLIFYQSAEVKVNDNRYAWRLNCADGSQYGISPYDYETRDAYNAAISSAKTSTQDSCEPRSAEHTLEDTLKQVKVYKQEESQDADTHTASFDDPFFEDDFHVYTYCRVKLADSEMTDYYRTEDKTLKKGEMVVIPTSDMLKTTQGEVLSVERHMRFSVPQPVEETLEIIGRVT